ncbi:D-2-hydroxyacid dehydrogenase [Cohnella sp. LGH]|uniref:D-2-hydroxyacid dehydrogenase n=1 Tax=Cohnella sp. LGH TaxID=1619153 RepID=UPI001ADD4705|nr:D-2-hydroxyacid dehydrogenase [Cohnella sp. LGH]QTH42685.1 D-2-hydroxyacid dehydrogenase [Cohnella sp. LGH]
MSKRTMVVLQPLPGGTMERIRLAAPGWDIVGGAEADGLSRLREAEIVCGWKPEAAERCLAEGARLRWLQVWGAGVDKLPLDRLDRAGVTVTTASGVHPNPVSETAFAMMLSFSRGLHTAVRNQVRSAWQSAGSLSEIHGKTLGIVGVGVIGLEMAKLAKAFGMRVMGIRRSGETAENVDWMCDIGGLNELLRASDYVVAVMPLTGETRHMFGRDQFAAMKRTAYFINVSRGGTTDTEALVAALREGEIAGAGLDVFEQEPLPSGHPLWAMNNVIVTPHNGGVTDRYEERATDIFLANLDAYLQGRTLPINRVDPVRQY